MSELNESVHVVFDDATVITVPLVTNLTATNAAPTAKTVGDALAGKVDTGSVMQHVRISVDGVQSDNQGVILIDGTQIPADGGDNAQTIRQALDSIDGKTGADILYQGGAGNTDTIKDMVGGIQETVGDIQEYLENGFRGDQIPVDGTEGAKTVTAAINEVAAALAGKEASNLPYSTDVTIKAKMDAIDAAVPIGVHFTARPTANRDMYLDSRITANHVVVNAAMPTSADITWLTEAGRLTVECQAGIPEMTLLLIVPAAVE